MTNVETVWLPDHHGGGIQVDLRTLVSDLVTSYTPMAAAGVTFFHTIDATVPKVALLDPLRIRQILANGVTNALKYTPSGEVRVHVR